MSAALHSLMRALPLAVPQRQRRGDMLAFLVVGAGGALGFVVLSTLVIWLHTGWADWLVNTACYAAMIGPVYLLHHRYSFASDAAHGQALPRYLVVQGMALVLAAGLSYGAHEIAHLPTLSASIVVVGLTAGINYMVLRAWAFAHPRPGVALAA